MKNFIQEGTRVDWTNTTGSAVASGDVVIVGSLAAIAVVDIADTKSGEVALEGVYELTKDTPLAISQGDEVFWNTTNKEVTKTATDKPLGVAFRAAGSSDTTVQVKIYGQGNGIPVAATVAALTDNSGGTADATLEDCNNAVTGVDGTGSNAASKADVDARLVSIANNFADLAAKQAAILTSLKNAGLMA